MVGGRERERQTDRQTDREGGRDRLTDKEIETDRTLKKFLLILEEIRARVLSGCSVAAGGY